MILKREVISLTKNSTTKWEPLFTQRKGKMTRVGQPTIAGWIETKFAEEALKELESIESAFRKFDTDGSGEISISEFQQALRSFGIRVDAEEAAKLVDKYDTDGNGSISIQEFRGAIKDMLKKGKVMLYTAYKILVVTTDHISEVADGPPGSAKSPTAPRLEGNKVGYRAVMMVKTLCLSWPG